MRSSMLPRRLAEVVLAVFSVFGVATTAQAQSIGTGLAALLTEQTPPPAGFERDRAAAEATFGTVAGLFAVELTSLPVVSSSGGFAYRFSPTLGTMERATDSFGPFFTERAVRNGVGRLSLGLTYQFASFETLQGADLTSGTFPTNAARFVNQLQPFSVDTLSLTLDVKTVTAFASYGATDRLDVGVVAPITSLSFSGRACKYVPRGVVAPVEPVGFGKRVWGSRRQCAVPPDRPDRKRRGGWQRPAVSHRPGRGPARSRRDSLATAGHRVMGKGPRRRGRERGHRPGWNISRTVLGRSGHLRREPSAESGWRTHGPPSERAEPPVRRLPAAPRHRGGRDDAMAPDGRWRPHCVFRDRRQVQPLPKLDSQCQSAHTTDRHRAQGPVYSVHRDQLRSTTLARLRLRPSRLRLARSHCLVTPR